MSLSFPYYICVPVYFVNNIFYSNILLCVFCTALFYSIFFFSKSFPTVESEETMTENLANGDKRIWSIQEPRIILTEERGWNIKTRKHRLLQEQSQDLKGKGKKFPVTFSCWNYLEFFYFSQTKHFNFLFFLDLF